MFRTVRTFGRRHPRLRAVFRPAWKHATQLLWTLRSGLLGQWPITFATGKHTVSMVTKGQIAEFVWRGAFEESERNLVAREIKSGMRVLNIGANVGLYTIIASKLVGPDGMVHAFEPPREISRIASMSMIGIGKSTTREKLTIWRPTAFVDMRIGLAYRP